MKHFYALLGRTLFSIAIPLLRIYFTSHSSRRVRVLIVNDQNEVLLIKGWFSRQWWELPGGGIQRKESAHDAVVRETYEETGIEATRADFTFLNEFKHSYAVTLYQVVLFALRANAITAKPPGAYAWEIIDCKWFSVKNLPKNISPLVSRSLAEYAKVEK